MMPATDRSAGADRSRLLRAVHARAREIGLGADERQALQQEVTGHASCRDMDARGLRRVLTAMDRLAPKTARTPRRRDRLARGPHTRKIWALWMTAWNLGIIHDRSESALVSFVKRQTGLEAAAWAHSPTESVKVVEGLKAWLARPVDADRTAGAGGGGVDWSAYAVSGRGRVLDKPRARILEAQWRILAGLGVVRIADDGALANYARRHAGIARHCSHIQLTDADARDLINHLGERIRQAQQTNRPHTSKEIDREQQ